MSGHSPETGASSTIRLWAIELVRCAEQFSSFLRRPNLTKIAPSKAPIRETIQLFIILGALMVAVSVLLLPLMLLNGVEASDQLGSALSAPPFAVILAVVILGPIMEEIAFRSWLEGSWHHLIGGGLFVAILFGGRSFLAEDAPAWIPYGILLAAILAYVMTVVLLPNKARPTLFERAFPVIFWLNAVIFGALHMSNYTGTAGPILLAFTVPQIIAGAVFGYARLKIGLVAAIALHMAFNAIPVAGIIVTSQL